MKRMLRISLALLSIGLLPACDQEGDTSIIQNLSTPDVDPGPFQPGVVFQMQRELSPLREIWGADLEGTRLVRLSGALQALGNVFGWAWSPDREWVAFVADKQFDDIPALYAARTTGPGVPIQITPVFSSIAPELHWAPDSSRVAFLGDNGATLDLYTARPDDPSACVQVSGALVAGGNILGIAWAPDSSRIAYIADQDTLNSIELYTSPPDSAIGNVKVNGALIPGGGLPGGGQPAFAWAPDSSRIAYRAVQDALYYELYTSFPTTAVGNVKVSAPIAGVLDQVYDLAWSPTSTRIAYFAGLINTRLHSSAPDTAVGSVQVSGVGQVANGWSWAPDGSRIAFGEAGQIYSTGPTGAGLATVNGPLTAGGAAGGPAWAPDSSRIAYRADQETDDTFEIFTSLPDGSGNVKVSGPQTGGDADGPIWSSDSSWIVYRSTADSAFNQFYFTRPTNAQSVVQISAVIASGVAGGAWTSDGSHFVFPAAMDVASMVELYSANPQTGAVLKVSGPYNPVQQDVQNFTPR